MNRVNEVSNELDLNCTFEPRINTTSMILAEMQSQLKEMVDVKTDKSQHTRSSSKKQNLTMASPKHVTCHD